MVGKSHQKPVAAAHEHGKIKHGDMDRALKHLVPSTDHSLTLFYEAHELIHYHFSASFTYAASLLLYSGITDPWGQLPEMKEGVSLWVRFKVHKGADLLR